MHFFKRSGQQQQSELLFIQNCEKKLQSCDFFLLHLIWDYIPKGHSFCKQCLHDLQFMKTRYSSPNLSKVARVDISCQFKETRYLCRHCLQNEWTLAGESKIACTILLFSWVESIHLRWKNLSYKASHFLTNWEVIYGSPLILLELQSLFDMAETRQKGCVLK